MIPWLFMLLASQQQVPYSVSIQLSVSAREDAAAPILQSCIAGKLQAINGVSVSMSKGAKYRVIVLILFSEGSWSASAITTTQAARALGQSNIDDKIHIFMDANIFSGRNLDSICAGVAASIDVDTIQHDRSVWLESRNQE